MGVQNMSAEVISTEVVSLQLTSNFVNERISSGQGPQLNFYCHVCCEFGQYFSRPRKCRACKSMAIESVPENSTPEESTRTYQSPPLVRETRQPLILQNGRIMEASSLEQRRKSEKVREHLAELYITIHFSDFKEDIL